MKRLIDYSSRFRILKGGKISLVVSALLGSVTLTFASPSGGTVTSGLATINQNGTVTNINQSTAKASINWITFNMASNETVNFNQPNASSITLNRVIGNETSIINGALNANGQVWILNSNGVLFNSSASINTSGLIATTAKLSDVDFQAGNYNFTNATSNSVVNKGTINIANAGSVILASNEVINEETIQAVKGSVNLVGANSYSVNLNGNSLLNLTVNKGVLDALVKNSGHIIANGGEIYLTTNAVNELLKGVVNHTGIIEANGIDDLSGKVTITAEEINLKSGSIISVTGEKGGGEVLIGGDWQGNGELKQAVTVTMESGATIDASATEDGNGGKVVLWSDITNQDSITNVQGSIFAKGGVNSGDGGKVETSGKYLNIGEDVEVSTKAVNGEDGLWLLDPDDLWIVAGDHDGYNYTTTGTTTYGALSATTNGTVIVDSVNDTTSYYNGASQVRTDTIINALSNGNVTVLASGDISYRAWDVNGDETTYTNYWINSTTVNKLTLNAGSSIILGGHNIDLPNGTLELLARTTISQGAYTFTGHNPLESGAINVATLILGSSDGGTSKPSVDLTTANNYITYLQASNISSLSFTNKQNFTVNATGLSTTGNIALTSTGNITLNGDITTTSTSGTGVSLQATGITQNAGVDVTTSGANIDYTVTNAAWTAGEDIALKIGDVGTLSTIDASGGNISINSSFIAVGVSGNSDRAIRIRNTDITTSNSGTINLTGDATNNNNSDNSAWGIALEDLLVQSDSGAITLTGTAGGSANPRGIVNDSKVLKILSNSGAITFIDATSGVYSGLYLNPSNASNIYFGADGSTVATSSSDVTIQAGKMALGTNNSYVTNINTSGNVVLESNGASFDEAIDTTNLSIIGTPSSLRIGKTTNTQNITIGSSTTIGGNIAIYGGNIAINNKLEATNSTITLNGSGTITDGTSGYLIARNLLLSDGAVTLDNTSNDIDNIGASGVDSLTFYDTDGFDIGSTIGSTTGISSSGNVLLNAGADESAGTSTGGDITVTGTPTVSSTNGYVKLYTGSINGSTTATTLITAGNFRYNSDETNTNFTTTLGTTGKYLIYREQPTATVTANDKTITYGADNPTYNGTETGIVNGDESLIVYSLTGGTTSTAGKTKAGTYTIDAEASALTNIGYSVTQTDGTLTVNKKDLTVSYSGTDKIYDATTNTTVTESVVAVETNDVVTITETAVFANKDVGTNKTVNISTIAIAGVDAGNYNLTSTTATTTANISKADLTVTADDRTKTYGDSLTLGSSAFTSTGLQNSETIGSVTLGSTNSYDTSTNQDAGSYTNEITISNATGGTFDIGNYNVTYENGDLTINQKALNISYVGTDKTYDATTNATVTETLTGVINSDNVTITETSVFDNKDVGTNKNISITGITLGGKDAGNYNLTSTTATTTANISKADLTVVAGDDAKFVTQSDTSGYNGVTYSGFVGGESSTDLGGTLAISRTNLGTNSAGTYNDVLVASGLSSSNYNIIYENGDYTIVPADQLLVKVTNVSDTYGTDTQYALASVQYLNYGDDGVVGGTDANADTIITLGSGSGTVSINTSNEVSIADGAGSTANFILAPKSSKTSTAGILEVGSYQLEATGINITNGGNFGNVLTIVGAHQVNQKGITATVSNVSKIYDGTTSVNGVSFGLNTLETNDVVTVNGSGAFSDKNVGTNLNYTISNLSLTGTDASNYYLTNGLNLSGSNGAITKKDVTVSYIATNKTYDGTTNVIVSESTSDIISGDTVTISETATFDNKNVGTNKTVNISSIALNGADAGNYNLTSTTTTSSADITRLDSVTWIGGATGNWFDTANWTGGAIPDLSNVANVIIPSGVTVTFDTTNTSGLADSSGAVNIDSLGNSNGSLTQNNGTLNVGSNSTILNTLTQNGGVFTSIGSILLNSFVQTNGSTSTNNNLTVNNSYSYGTSGSITVGGNTNITDKTGGIVLGNLNTTGTTTISSTAGDITQALGTEIVSTGITTLNAGLNDVTLDNANNDFQDIVNATGKDITLRDVNRLTAQLNASGNSIISTGGNLKVSGTTNDISTTTTNGGITTFGDLKTTVNGTLNVLSDGNIFQTEALSVKGTSKLNAGNNDIILTHINNNFQSSINTTGQNVTLIREDEEDIRNNIAIQNIITPIVNTIATTVPRPLVYQAPVTPKTQAPVIASAPSVGTPSARLVPISEINGGGSASGRTPNGVNADSGFRNPAFPGSNIMLVNGGGSYPFGVPPLVFETIEPISN